MKFILIYFLLNTLFLFNTFYNLQMLQQNGYNDYNHYLKFFLKDYKNNYLFYIIILLNCIITYIFKDFIYIFIFLMIVLIIRSFKTYTLYNNKLPLRFTKRLIRILSLDLLFYIILVFLLKNNIIYTEIGLLIYTIINPFILVLIIYILSPVEKMILHHYEKMATDKLDRMTNIMRIGITGSFGKTSTKMCLESIMKTKYKGFYTPASYNNPNGISITINNETSIFNEYFICEMAAKKEKEIKELCDLIHPKYGILTSIGAAHLESFKTLDNICNTKFELIESLPFDGIGILNKDDEFMRNYKLKNKCKIVWIGIDKKADVMAKNIEIGPNGTTFDVVFKDETIKVNTILLGKKNVYNILASCALAHELGVNKKDIIKGVKEIPPIKHRCEIKHSNNALIIDDAFNSNPEGAKNAVDILSLMPGEKIVITPGMVEMGDEEYNLNFNFGKQIAKVADKVYLVGKKQTKPIYDGLLKEKYNKDNIFIFNSFKEGFDDIIKVSGNKKINILIENDLPDSYTERK